MARKKTRRDKSRQQPQKNLVRGMIGILRSRRHGEDPEIKARQYRFMQRRALLTARSAIPLEEYDSFLDWFAKQTSLEAAFVKTLPVGMDFLMGVLEAPPVPLINEIAWLTSRLVSVSDTLNNFIRDATELERALWSGSLEESFACLDGLEKKFGQSMWLLSLRIAAEQYLRGLEAQKTYVERLKGPLKRGLVPYVAHYLSVRNEPSVTKSWYFEDMSRRIRRSRYDDRVRAYLTFRLLGAWPTEDERLADILRIEQSHSDVDLYETFVALAQHVVSARTDASLRSIMLSSLQRLGSIEDARLLKARAFLGGSVSMDYRTSDSAGEALQGHLRRAHSLAASSLASDPGRVDDALVLAFVRAGLSSRPGRSKLQRLSPLWLEAVNHLARIFLRQQDFSDAQDALQKLAINFRGTRIGEALVGSASAEMTGDLLDMTPALRTIALNLPQFTFCDARANLTQPVLSPDLAGNFFLAAHGRAQMPTALHRHAKVFGSAVAAARNGDWVEAGRLSSELLEGTVEPVRARAALLHMHAAIRQEDVESVLENIEREIATGGISKQLLPHVQVVQNRRWPELRDYGARLGLSIVLDLAFRATGDDRTATYRRFAYDLFLKRNGVTKASELDPLKFQSGSLIYFLRNVAVPSVLDMSEALTNSRETQEERREILSLLVTIDPERSNEYHIEILEITERLEIAEGIRLVDSSRIHVDTDAIESWANRELKDAFLRYRTLVQSGVGVAEDFESVIQGLKRRGESDKHLFAVPQNEADELLLNLMNTLLGQFLFDPAHGLDSYLSRRIRHGSIVGFLRGPVEEAKLITLRDEATDTYIDNIYWLDQLTDLTGEESESVRDALNKFGREFDNALIHLRDDVIQIKDNDHPDGVFDLKVFTNQFHLVRSALRDVDDFSLFVGICFVSFWSVVDVYLWQAREIIREELRNKLSIAFDDLRGSVNLLQSTVVNDLLGFGPMARKGLVELNAAITTAQTCTQSALEDAAEWFTRSEVQVASKVYTLQEAMNIAIQSALARLRRYEPELQYTVEEGLGVPAADLSGIADIVLITLGNACERSGIPKGVNVTMDVRLTESGDLLVFTVENDVAPEKRSPETLALLESIRNEIDSGSTTELVRRERRSGLRKLGSVRRRFPKASLTFGFTDSGSFRVVAALPFDTTPGEEPSEDNTNDAGIDR